MYEYTLIAIFLCFGSLHGKLNPPECGRRPLSSRVMGGTESIPGDFGWQVSFLYDGSHNCGGVLLNNNYVLSAAHCVFTMDLSVYQIILGLHDRTKLSPWSQKRNIVKIIMHENYETYPSPINDIVLLKLDRPVEFSDYIIPACIPDGSENFENYSGVTTGWGRTSTFEDLSVKKLQVVLPILTNARCSERYGSFVNLDAHICSGESGKQMGACLGDSGGPLSVQSNVPENNQRWYVCGLTSFLTGFYCGNGAVYTRVSTYKNWIEANMID